MSWQIRLANRADLAGVLALYRELRPNDPVLTCAEADSAWNTVLSDPAVSVIVATDDAVIVSTCVLGVVPILANGGRPFGIIEHVITARTHRLHGVCSRCAGVRAEYGVVPPVLQSGFAVRRRS